MSYVLVLVTDHKRSTHTDEAWTSHKLKPGLVLKLTLTLLIPIQNTGWLTKKQAGSRCGSRRVMLHTYARLKLSRTDTQMDRWMDRHCATIRASLACASRANKSSTDSKLTTAVVRCISIQYLTRPRMYCCHMNGVPVVSCSLPCLVDTWMGDCPKTDKLSWHVTGHPGRLSLLPAVRW